uniref:Ig-like domain-containing protein n=1 Tax=Oryctolagus cuniculus TaxID=9986 RepID=G1TUA1_RABIT
NSWAQLLRARNGVLSHLFPTGSSVAQTVTQTQPEMSVQEAETATLDCTYDTGDSNYYLFWYKQPPSGELVLIIRQEAYKPQNATQNRFSVNFQKASKSFSLKISDSQLGDAGMYLCAFASLTVIGATERGLQKPQTSVLMQRSGEVFRVTRTLRGNRCVFWREKTFFSD